MIDIEELILLREHSRLLVMNSWRLEIPEVSRNIIIANALNDCVLYKNLNLVGYLITTRRVFIIGASENTPFQEILYHFYHTVETGIAEYKKMRNEYDGTYHSEHHVYHKLFTPYPFLNDYIRALITGKEVNLPYYDPYLKHLKHYIHHHNYCSALDYSGGKSPVIVATDDIIL
ncbi:hypothetical protein [uncultured Kordia sp.]|uniref:hypothetical protein n=1 Tax=uncultured Kordia sp. TaxID=507699 RepID=UPI002621A454|nr:hypothetical protein [uncultured Kordia sp.]